MDISNDTEKNDGQIQRWRHAGLIVLGVLALTRMAMMSIVPLTDPSEGRYAVICKNMADSGNFLEPQFVYNGKWQNFEGKPPLYFQIGALSCKVFGASDFSVRLPALLCASLTLACIFFVVRRAKDEPAAWLATLFCASSYVFFLFSGVCLTDMTLVVSVTGAVLAYMLFEHETERKNKKRASMLFFAALGVGMLAKGPVAIVLSGMPVFIYVALNKRWRTLKDHAWLMGGALFLLIAVPWYALMAAKNPGFLKYFFINENIMRFLVPNYGDRYGSGHEMFKGVAVLWTLMSNIPMLFTFFIPVREGEKSIWGRGMFRDPVTGLAALLLLTTTGFWCLTSRVPCYYVLPTVPAVAILAALQFQRIRWMAGEERVRRWATTVGWVDGLMVAIGLSVSIVIGTCCTSRMPESCYSQFLAMKSVAKNHTIYFAGQTPYSAGFYLPRWSVVNHPRESVPASVTASAKSYLFVTDSQLKRLPQGLTRKQILNVGTWNVFAPDAEGEMPHDTADNSNHSPVL